MGTAAWMQFALWLTSRLSGAAGRQPISGTDVARHELGPGIVRDAGFDRDRHEAVVLELPDIAFPRPGLLRRRRVRAAEDRRLLIDRGKRIRRRRERQGVVRDSNGLARSEPASVTIAVPPGGMSSLEASTSITAM